MAEIKVEKKKPVWPWILIIVLIILALLYFFVFADNDGDDDYSNSDDIEQVETRDSIEIEGNRENTDTWEDEELSDSLTDGFTSLSSAYYSAIEEESKLGVDTVYTSNALLKLVDAVKAKAMENQVSLNSDLDQMRKNTMESGEDAQSISSEKLKDMGDKIVKALENIQQKEYPQLTGEVEEAATTVEQIEAGKQMSNQQEKIKAFFNKTADILQKMN